MNEFLCSAFADEIDSEYYTAFLIKDNSYFYNTVYQIVKRNASDRYVKVYKVIMNGNIKLVYDTEGLTSLIKFAMSAKTKDFMEVIEKIINELVKIRTDSFVQLETVDIRPDRIFLDEERNPKFICLPVSIMSGIDTLAMFEANLRALITNILYQSECMDNAYIKILFDDCMNMEASIDDLVNGFKEKKYGIFNDTSETDVSRGRESIYGYFWLKAEDSENVSDIIVTKQNFVIGKSETETDYTIKESTAVSRRHLEFVISERKIFILDLGSTNGTYVNGNLLTPDSYVPVNYGDIIDIADLRYTVLSSMGE